MTIKANEPGELRPQSTPEWLVLQSLTQTCGACPSQWEGVTESGDAFYARYRHGRLSWGVAPSPEEAVRLSMESRCLEVGDPDGGVMATAEMLAHVGASARSVVDYECELSGRSDTRGPSHVVRDSGRKLHLQWLRPLFGGRTMCGRSVPDHWNEKSARCWQDNPEARCQNCEAPLGPRAVIAP